MDQPILDSIELLSTGWLKKYKLHFTMPDGQPHTYETISRREPEAYARELRTLQDGGAPHPDAVSIVPILPDGSVVMIREYRYALDDWCYAFPAGLIDAGEAIETAVARELSAETGYRIARTPHAGHDRAVRPLPQTSFSSNGMSEESVQVVFVDVEPDHDAPHPEKTEFIETFVMPQAEIAPFLKNPTLRIGARGQLILAFYAATGTIL